jgi:hypothetical protein
MAFTRFHDDPARIAKQLQQQTDQGRWAIDVPGNGDKPCFMLDPQIIPQKWGGNLWTKSIDIQSSLLGIDRPLNRDCLKPNEKYVKGASPIVYPVCDSLTTEQSRTIMPAWTARDLPQNHAYILPENPQANTEMHFRNNVSTRVLEKDNFKRDLVCPSNNQEYTKPVINGINGINNKGKEGFSNNIPNNFNNNMPSVGKNDNINYARLQFEGENGTYKRHVR